MADRTHLTSAEIEQIATKYSALSGSYLKYMRDFGWGEAPSGHMVYSAPISPKDVYPQLADDRNRMLISDDTQGYCLAYDVAAKQFGEYSPRGEWSYFDERFDLAAYLNGDAAG